MEYKRLSNSELISLSEKKRFGHAKPDHIDPRDWRNPVFYIDDIAVEMMQLIWSGVHPRDLHKQVNLSETQVAMVTGTSRFHNAYEEFKMQRLACGEDN